MHSQCKEHRAADFLGHMLQWERWGWAAGAAEIVPPWASQPDSDSGNRVSGDMCMYCFSSRFYECGGVLYLDIITFIIRFNYTNYRYWSLLIYKNDCFVWSIPTYLLSLSSTSAAQVSTSDWPTGLHVPPLHFQCILEAGHWTYFPTLELLVLLTSSFLDHWTPYKDADFIKTGLKRGLLTISKLVILKLLKAVQH